MSENFAMGVSAATRAESVLFSWEFSLRPDHQKRKPAPTMITAPMTMSER